MLQHELVGKSRGAGFSAASDGVPSDFSEHLNISADGNTRALPMEERPDLASGCASFPEGAAGGVAATLRQKTQKVVARSLSARGGSERAVSRLGRHSANRS